MTRLLRIATTMVAIPFLMIPVSASVSLAQDGSACNVEPRSAAELEALSQQAVDQPLATPSASPAPEDGLPVSPQVVDQLEITLHMVESCTRADDISRLAALFTDRGAIDYLFGSETVTIVQGTPPATTIPSIGTPPVRSDVTISKAVLLRDGRILATVIRESDGIPVQQVWFENVDGRYLIDEIVNLDGVPDATNDEQAIEALVLAQVQVPAGAKIDVSVEPVDWPDTALGCPAADGVYATVITPGYRVLVTIDGDTLEFHTDTRGTVVQCETEA